MPSAPSRSLRALLAVVALAGICALCCGAEQAQARPATPAAATVADGSVYGEIASFILSNIGSTLVGDATDAVLGQVLDAVGLGDDTGAQLTAISNKLDQINSKLDALSNQVSQVLSAVQQGTCATLSGQLAQTRSTIDVAWNEYVQLATLKSQAARKAAAATLLTYLDSQINFPAQELEIHNTLVSPGAGAEGLVTACGQAVQSPSALLTAKSAGPVREVLDFWQAYETKLLLLQTEDLDAHHQRSAAKAAVASVKANLEQEVSTLLPPVPAGYFYDKKTQRLWFLKVPIVATYTEASAYASHITQTQKRQWHIPTAADITSLGNDCCPGAVSASTSFSSTEGFQTFYGALVRLAGVQFAPVAGSAYAQAIEANAAAATTSTSTSTTTGTTATQTIGGTTVPLDRNHVFPVMNGFSNVSSGNIGGYVFVWYHVGKRVRYAY
jgi:hypothetical protein